MVARFSRRGFIGGMAAVGATTCLAACQPQTVEVTKVVDRPVEVTKVIEKPVEVTKVIEKPVEVTKVIQVTAPAGQQVRVTWYAWGDPLKPGRYADYEQGFAKQSSNVVLQTILVPSGPDYYTKLLTSIAAKQGPDIVLLEGQYLRKFVKQGTLANLDDNIKADKFDLSQYYESMVNLGRVKNQLYAFPLGSGPQFIWYWKRLFADAKLQDPHELWQKGEWTWGAYLEAAKALTRVNAQGQAQQLGSGRMFETTAASSYLKSAGASLLNADWTEVTLGQGKGPETMQWLLDLDVKHHVTPGEGPAQTVGTASDDFARWQGRLLAMVTLHFVAPTWLIDRETKQFPHSDFSWVPYPKYNAAASHFVTWNGSGYSLSKASKNADAGWQVMKWMFSEPGIKIWLESTYYHMCPLKSLANSDYYLKRMDPAVLDVKAELEMLDAKYQVILPTPVESFDWEAVLGDEFGAARLGKKSIDRMIVDLKKRGDPILAKGM